MAEGNGHYERFSVDLKALADRQESLVTKAIEELKDVMREGHSAIADEIRKVREVGSLPIPLVEKLIDHQNNMNTKNSDKTYKILTLIFGACLAAVLGLKAFFPQILGG